MPETASVVIIGGGVIGCSIAYHLARRGMRDVVIVERNFVASGATGKSSACIRQHYSTPEACRMVLDSVRFFQTFEERTGGRTASFVPVGYLLGVDERRRRALETSVSLQQAVGIRTRLVSRQEMQEIEPRLRVDDFAAGCYEPDAGYADPAGTAHGFAGAARDAGVRIWEQTEALGITTTGGRVRGVRTSRSEIETPVVVNAANLWADRVARMVAIEVPITVCRHPVSFFTRPESAARPHPLVYDFVNDIYTRPETGNLTLVGALSPEEASDQVDPDRYLEGVTFDETARAMERVIHRFPDMEHGVVGKGYAGCFDMSPDGYPVLDESPVGGFYLAIGLSGHGFKLAPAIGDMMARLLLDGKKPSDDIHAFRFSRFAEGRPIRSAYADGLMS